MELLQQAYSRDSYLNFLAGKFIFSRNLADIAIDSNEVKTFKQLGFVSTGDGKQLPIFEIHIKPNTQLSRNRVQLRNLVAKQIHTEDGALAVYVDEPNKQWRFSFIAIEYVWNDDGLTKTQTASKRFTYLFGENTQTRTAQERFFAINKQSTLEDLKKAFAVEALNKEFYDKLYKWYEKAQDQVTFPNDEKADNHTQTSLIRLLTRLLFIWFLKEKKLINPDLFDKDKLPKLIKYDQPSSFYKAILQNLFFATLSTEIEKRSFRREDSFHGKKKDYGNQYRYRYHALVKDIETWKKSFSQTPFLNGGLFESLDRKLKKYILDENGKPEKNKDDKEIINEEHKKLIDEWDKNIRPEKTMIRIEGFSEYKDNPLSIGNALFFNNPQDLGLIDIFNQYQFTVEESTPLDIEVALDPELLGKVFENLLASYNPETGQQARKATGSFYTPREIVSYMVDESLKAYLLEKAPPHDGDSVFYKERLQDLMSVSDKTGALPDQDDALIYPEEIAPLIKAISSIKIIDPAVGSGAFPMGLLQRMTALLAILDPDNKGWKKQKLAELPDLRSIEADLKISEKISDTQAKQQAKIILSKKKQDIITDFEKQDHNYLRKLYLIEQCIYGVDIQPIAIQICKLRFFISLTIEQTPNPDKDDNYGIVALPNLETKFIVANSLLPLGEMPKQAGIFDGGIKELQQQLAEVRHEHFSAGTSKTNLEYKDKSLREQMLAELTETGITPNVEASMRKIVAWNLYNQNAAADWFDPQWQFGVTDGFDIVIGNPPYLKERDNKHVFNPIKGTDWGDKYHRGKMDYWYFFLHRSLEMAGSGGVIAFITSRYWINSRGAKNIIKHIREQSYLFHIVDIGKLPVFEEVAGHHMLHFYKTGEKQKHCLVKLLKESLDGLNSDSTNNFVSVSKQESKNLFTKTGEIKLYSDPFSLSSFGVIGDFYNVTQGVVQNPDKVSKVMARRFRLEQGRGVFVLRTDELSTLNLNNKELSYVRLFFDEAQVQCFHLNRDTKKHLLYITKNNCATLEGMPNIKKHLLLYRQIMDGRRETIKGVIKWFQMHWPRDSRYFELEKVVFPSMFSKPRAAYVEQPAYFGLGSNVIIGGNEIFNLKLLTAILNSSIAYWWFHRNGKKRGTGVDIGVERLRSFPLSNISRLQSQTLSKLVDKILTAKQNNTDTTALEAKIDQMVYKLYNLTKAEIKIIEDEK